MRTLVLRGLSALVLLTLAGPVASFAQTSETAPEPPPTEPVESSADEVPAASFFATTTVTALGREVDTFQVATPVSVLPPVELERRLVDNPAVLLRDLPGVDVNGVGVNQVRPVIRGQRGLRVLFLENGLRMNNARRQTDFGEITGLTDLGAIETVEVVRGPASVLYGSDAIGGVLNVVTKVPASRPGHAFGGSLEGRYASVGEQQTGRLSLDGQVGAFTFLLGGTSREVDDYEAPAGRFGQIRLAEDTVVNDTGLDDESQWGYLGYRLSDRHGFALRASRYRADQAGFGFVDPAVINDPSSALVRILYPFQDFDRQTLTYTGDALGHLLVDTVDVKLYRQTNERALVNDVFVDLGVLVPGGGRSSVSSLTNNFTDLDTTGLRVEALKVIDEKNLLTYGVEGYRDESVNTDESRIVTSLVGPGLPPRPIVQTSTRANTPNATNTSWGVFLQDEITLGERVRLTGGARYQKVETQAETTPQWNIAGLDFEDDQLVGSLTATYQMTDSLNLLASYGSAFRAPNIVERLFNGPTPEGTGYQILNADLTSERSRSADLGIKYRRADAFLELVVFQSDVEDGVIQAFLTPAEIAALPADLRAAITATRSRAVVQQRNVDRLRYRGVELAVGYRHRSGVAVGGNYTYLDAERREAVPVPVDDLFNDKLNFFLRYEPTGSRFWGEYRLRRNGAQDNFLSPGEPAPLVGTTLPSFTLHSLAGGARLFEAGRWSHELTVVADNLTDELYAETSNISFFRPEPGRSVTVSYRLGF